MKTIMLKTALEIPSQLGEIILHTVQKNKYVI